jgi:hypothetical protein
MEGGVDATQTRHLVVEDGRMWVRVQSTAYRCGTILAVDDYRDVVAVPQQGAQNLSQGGVVLGEQNPDAVTVRPIKIRRVFLHRCHDPSVTAARRDGYGLTAPFLFGGVEMG